MPSDFVRLSADVYLNLATVTEVYFLGPDRDSPVECAVVYFAAADSQVEDEQIGSRYTDPDILSRLRMALDRRAERNGALT
jgi:hypothetical protein